MQSTNPNNISLTIKSYLGSAVARNAGSLYLLQFANYLLPLITVPYVLRILTPSGYGLVAFAQSFVGYFMVLVDYGFGFSATRKISVARHDLAAVSRTVFSVWVAKLLLCFIGFLVLLFFVNLVPTLRQNRGLLFIVYGMTLGNVLFPGWLFQGMERMVHISVINLLIRLLVVVGIFTLIKRPEDYLWYAGLTSFASVATGLVGMSWALYLFSLPVVRPSWQDVWQALKEGWMLFLSTASISLFTVGNAFILGMLTNPTVVGYFSAGEKIVKAGLGLIGPIVQAVYPRFSKLAADSKQLALYWSKRMLLAMGFIGMSLSLILFFGAPLIVKLILGDLFKPSLNVIRILSPLIFLVSTASVWSTLMLIPFGKDFVIARIVFGAGVINIITALLLVPLHLQAGMAVAVLFSEIFVNLSSFIYAYRFGINPLCGIFDNFGKAHR